MLADAQTKVTVESFLKQFLESYRNRDLEGLIGMVSHANDLYMFGTGIDEKRTCLQEFKSQAARD